jgi:hypothetical protein
MYKDARREKSVGRLVRVGLCREVTGNAVCVYAGIR